MLWFSKMFVHKFVLRIQDPDNDDRYTDFSILVWHHHALFFPTKANDNVLVLLSLGSQGPIKLKYISINALCKSLKISIRRRQLLNHLWRHLWRCFSEIWGWLMSSCGSINPAPLLFNRILFSISGAISQWRRLKILGIEIYIPTPLSTLGR